MEKKGSALALTPLIVFLVLFLGTGLYFNAIGTDMAFYQLPSPVAAVVGIIIAFLMGKGTIDEKMDSFIAGVGESNILIMCMIYLLAGAFSSVAGAMGGVDSTVNFGLSIIPASLLLPGLFLISAFIATAMGTSMGTIAAVAPIAVDMAAKTGLPVAVAVGTVVGGAMFGDNLSMISDTTIAATRTQGVAMRDKFIMNFKIALPAALVAMVLLLLYGAQGAIPENLDYSFIKILPYLAVLILALLGMNVFVVLIIGIVFAGGIGLVESSFSLLGFAQQIYAGFTGMQEIFILSLLIGGLANMIAKEGGIEYILRVINSMIKGKKGAEIGIGALVSVADICTANNTVAIVLAGPMAKDIAKENGVDPRRSASLLDIFACIFQGVIPYGAQLLLAGSIAGLSPLLIMPHLYYPYLLAVMVILAIIFQFPRAQLSNNKPVEESAN